MNCPRKKISLFKKIILVLIFALALNFSPVTTPKAHAAIWAMFVEQNFQEVLANLYRVINGIVVGIAKQTTVQQLTQQVTSMVSGGGASSGAMFITDWKDFLRIKPLQNSKKFINDYISYTLSGRNSASQYMPAGSTEGFGGGASYLKGLGDLAKKITSERKAPEVTYTNDPSQMFSNDSFNDLRLYVSGINNPWSFALDAQNNYQEEISKQELQAMAKGVAGQGYTGKENDKGKTITPGITVKDMLSSANDFANKVVAGANDIPSVIQGLVTQIVQKTLTQGIGKINQQLDKAARLTGGASTDLLKGAVDTGFNALY